jgi:hypothetical protein
LVKCNFLPGSAPDGLSLAQFQPSPCRARTGRKTPAARRNGWPVARVLLATDSAQAGRGPQWPIHRKMTVTDGRAGHFRTVSAVVCVRPGAVEYPNGRGVKPLGIGQEIEVGLMGDNPRLDSIHRDGFPVAARKALHRRRCASAILARPAVVFGPVDSPILSFPLQPLRPHDARFAKANCAVPAIDGPMLNRSMLTPIYPASLSDCRSRSGRTESPGGGSFPEAPSVFGSSMIW